MQVSDHEKACVRILHTHVVPEGAEVISQVEKPCGPDATHNYFFTYFHKNGEDSKKPGIRSSSFPAQNSLPFSRKPTIILVAFA
jgi:hypothetical protein